MTDIKLHYDDVTIVPDVTTRIKSRKECNPFVDGMLPIFASPMSSVIDHKNWKMFCDNKINVVIPRTVPFDERLWMLLDFMIAKNKNETPFVAFSLSEAEDMFINKNTTLACMDFRDVFNIRANKASSSAKVCIDLANGHMDVLLDVIKKIKKTYKDNIKIMSGNIANPKTYEAYEKAGCDYLRLSIGTGGACLTASNTGVYYPPFSLLKDTYEVKKRINGKCKLIADGGIKVYRDIQKALIYADYVMIGSLFNKCIESAGKTTYGNSYFKLCGHKFRNYFADFFKKGAEVSESEYYKEFAKVKQGLLEVNKMFYGMSTKIAQKETSQTGNINLKTSEGVVKTQKVEYTIQQWVENEISFLTSAMSYTNSKTLDEYKESEWIQVTGITYNK